MARVEDSAVSWAASAASPWAKGLKSILDLMVSTFQWEVSLALSDMQGTEFTEQVRAEAGFEPELPRRLC